MKVWEKTRNGKGWILTGPKLVENIVQGTSRDILAEAMMRLNKAGFSIVFHVHDEAVLEVPEGKSSVEEVCRIMAEPPSWVHGLPLRADGYECQILSKRIRRNCRMKLYISTGNSRMERSGMDRRWSLVIFLERLSHTVRTSETMEQYRKMSKAKQDSIKDVGGFVLGKLKGGRSKKGECTVSFRSDTGYGLCHRGYCRADRDAFLILDA